jgi:hypothetical protein
MEIEEVLMDFIKSQKSLSGFLLGAWKRDVSCAFQRRLLDT